MKNKVLHKALCIYAEENPMYYYTQRRDSYLKHFLISCFQCTRVSSAAKHNHVPDKYKDKAFCP